MLRRDILVDLRREAFRPSFELLPAVPRIWLSSALSIEPQTMFTLRWSVLCDDSARIWSWSSLSVSVISLILNFLMCLRSSSGSVNYRSCSQQDLEVRFHHRVTHITSYAKKQHRQSEQRLGQATVFHGWVLGSAKSACSPKRATVHQRLTEKKLCPWPSPLQLHSPHEMCPRGSFQNDVGDRSTARSTEVESVPSAMGTALTATCPRVSFQNYVASATRLFLKISDTFSRKSAQRRNKMRFPRKAPTSCDTHEYFSGATPQGLLPNHHCETHEEETPAWQYIGSQLSAHRGRRSPPSACRSSTTFNQAAWDLQEGMVWDFSTKKYVANLTIF